MGTRARNRSRLHEALKARNLWVVQVAAVGVAAFFSAEGLSAVAKMALTHGMAGLATPSASSPLSPLPPARMASADPILTRNAFDSVTGSLIKTARAAERSSEEGESPDPYEAPTCAKVHAVVIASFEDASASVAALEVEGDKAVLRRRGGEIGEAQIAYIATDRVFVREGNKLCQTRLFGPPAPPSAPRVEAAPKVGEGAQGGLDPALARGISRDGPNHFRIERSVVQRVLEDQSEIIKGAMIRPEKEGDRIAGVRLLAVRPDGLFGLLGLQGGDVIRSLNGYEFSSTERMLEAYARLRDATELRLEFTRGGQPSSLTYAIQ